MDHLERIRRVPTRLAAAGVALILAGACGGGDQVSNDQAGPGDAPAVAEENQATQPPATPEPSDPPASDGAGSTTDGDAAPEEPTPTSEATSTPAPTPTPPPPLQRLDAELLARGLDQPIHVTGAPGTEALFVVEREGIIRMVVDGVIAEEPFLDLRSEMTSSSIEQGLLGLAFHPSYETSGRFFAYWTTPTGDSRLAEFVAPAPTVGDPDTMRVILDIDQPAERHNAGMILFGPDGLLYLSLGDGGGGGSTAQDTSNLLGSIVRIDVDGGDPYAVPAGNPFGDELWVYGLRNPWRFTIDPVDELVYIGDVGQDSLEEINVVGLDGAGTNFGWLPMEGSLCFQGGCNPDEFTAPVHEYTHDVGCSVTGGHVYRGEAIPEFVGHYFYGDWCSGFVASFRFDGGQALDHVDLSDQLSALGQVTSFGVDNAGELYAVNWDGQLFRIVPVR